MSYQLNNVATTDGYPGEGQGASIVGDDIRRLVITVANSAVNYQLASPRGSWQPEGFLAPGVYTLARRCEGIRLKSAAPGNPARVTVEAATGADIAP